MRSSDTGSLRDGDLSLNMQGLRIRAEGAANASAAQTDTEYSGMTRDHMDVIRPLGEGSSGVVQLVRHKPTGQLMALKVRRTRSRRRAGPRASAEPT